jgi:hypothetical protein
MNLELDKQYLTDVNGNRIAVVLDINTYQKLLDELDEYYCLKGYEQAVTETEPEIMSGDYLTLEQYLTNRESKNQ